MPKLPAEAATAAANASDSRGDFEPLPPGVYRCRLDDVEAVTARSSGNPMWKVTYKVDQEGPFKNRKLWDNVVLHVDWKVKQFFSAFGLEPSSDVDTDALLGMPVDVKVGQRQKVRNGEEVFDDNGEPVMDNEVDRPILVDEAVAAAAGATAEEPF